MNFIKKVVLAGLLSIILFLPLAFAQIRVASIGDSVTEGYGLADAGTNSYPAQLQRLLGKGYIVGNFGKSGSTLLKKGHNPYYKSKQFVDALKLKANIIIIHLGLNDTDPRNLPDHQDEFVADYSWLIDTLRKESPQAKIFICKLTPIFSGHPRFKSGTREWYDQLQQHIPAIAKANNTALIDLNGKLFNRPELFADNLHPNKEGAQIIANTIYKSITGDFGPLKIAPIFNDHMVLQRLKPIPIYGTGNANDEIEVKFNGSEIKTTVDHAGNWKVCFPAMPHGGPHSISVSTKQDNILLSDILIGDVWLCSGQSNMDFKLRNASDGNVAIKSDKHNPLLRLYHLNAIAETDNSSWDSLTLTKTNQLDFFHGNWQSADSSSLKNFSAVAYYFGKDVVEATKIPIGLIQIAVGGSGTESWIDRATLEHDDLLVDMMSNWRKSDFIQQWCRERAALNIKNASNPLQRHPYQPAYNFEAGIAPLAQSPITGVIWYQGESNANNIELHAHLFKTLVKSWRSHWSNNFPFYYVQLSSLNRPSWPAFRNSQRLLQYELDNVGMAVTSDLGDSLNVHPTNKQPVGKRLALLALKHSYKKNEAAYGPEVIKAVLANQVIKIDFANARRLSTADHQSLRGFELLTERGQRINLEGTIHGKQIWLTVPIEQKVTEVRYAYEPFTRANLVNEANLPASTFKINLIKK